MLTDFLRSVVGEARCRVYDWRHGVHTCGNAQLDTLTTVGNNKSYGVQYHPSHPKFLFEVLGSLGIEYGRYTFVDFGSGKGRVLLVASEFPFVEIVGIEFAGELHDIACENIRIYQSGTQKCRNIRSLNVDAVEFEFSPTPLVLYFFNPFGPNVLVPVLRNLQRSLESNPRDVILIYMAPFHGDLIERETMLRCIERSAYHNTYRIPTSE